MKHGLAASCRENLDIAAAVKMIMALPHLPPERGQPYDAVVPAVNIADGVAAVKTYAEEKGISQEMQPVFNYLERFWMGIATPERFSVFSIPRRTDNALESFHPLLLGIMSPHTNIWRFVVYLYELLHIFHLEYRAAMGGNQIRINNRSVKNTENIRKSIGMLLRRGYTTTEFLRNASHTLDSVFNIFTRHAYFVHEMDLDAKQEGNAEEEGIEAARAIEGPRDRAEHPPGPRAEKSRCCHTLQSMPHRKGITCCVPSWSFRFVW
ncbi:hypothetical protein PR048_008268 [Dryococelus australis]|uniref:Uncharacterized protein n=1 Tax=Dryococelus australis TaxID=614101 RepID=A0ABQ9HWM3_9NEOP|nr:hypothetical protein PR048_008268 [Dryococelus australis]